MAAKRPTRYTTDEVLRLFQANETSSSDSSDEDQDFQRYVGTIVPSSEDGERSEDASDATDNAANVKIVSTSISTDTPQDADTSRLQSSGIDPWQSSDESERGDGVQRQPEKSSETGEDVLEQRGDSSEAGEDVLEQCGDSSEAGEDLLEQCGDSSEAGEDVQNLYDESSEVNEVVQEQLEEPVDDLSSDPGATSEDEAMEESTSSSSDEGRPTSAIRRGQTGRGRVRGFRRGRGRGRGQGHGQEPSHGRGRKKIDLPKSAVPIEVTDSDFEEEDEHCPLREVGLQMGGGSNALSELDLLGQYFSDGMIERLVLATNDYAEQKKDSKGAAYRRFKSTPLTKEEMWRYLGVLLLLSISSIRSYRQAWNPKSSQVRCSNLCTYALHC